MRVSVVFLFLFLSCVQLQRADDQLVVGPVQLLNKSRVERSEPDVWTELRELRDMVVEQKVKLQSQIEELQKQNAALEERVVSTEVGVEAQREENANRPKVVFSFASGLKGHHGPHSTDNILVFHREITNIGNAFSKTTGVFTAPFRGVYYFRFNVLSEKGPHMLAVCLFKNEEKILDVSEFPKETFEYVVGGATLQLEKGDEVYLKLRGHSQIYDNSDNHCTFSGFLLFAM